MSAGTLYSPGVRTCRTPYYSSNRGNSDEEGSGSDEEKEMIYNPSFESPNAKSKIALKGYTGCRPLKPFEADTTAFEESPSKVMIRGYSGYMKGSRNIIGVPIIPGETVQLDKLRTSEEERTSSPNTQINRAAGHAENAVEQSTLGSSFTNFRSYGKHMDIQERYETAIERLSKRGQTREMLLRMVQSKLSERVNNYADQHIRIRKIFEYFDLDGSNDLDEHEFRQFLEMSNVYFDDVQSLALFSFFDEDVTGGISWESFEGHAMVQNPKGGTAVVPKAITAVNTSDDWKSVGKNTLPNWDKVRSHMN